MLTLIRPCFCPPRTYNPPDQASQVGTRRQSCNAFRLQKHLRSKGDAPGGWGTEEQSAALRCIHRFQYLFQANHVLLFMQVSMQS